MREELNQGLIDFLKASPTPFHATASLVQRLEAAGLTLEWHEYPMRHEICRPQLGDIRSWLLARLGA